MMMVIVMVASSFASEPIEARTPIPDDDPSLYEVYDEAERSEPAALPGVLPAKPRNEWIRDIGAVDLFVRLQSESSLGDSWFVDFTEHDLGPNSARTVTLASPEFQLIQPGIAKIRAILPASVKTEDAMWTFTLWVAHGEETRKIGLGQIQPGEVSVPQPGVRSVPKEESQHWKGLNPEGNPLDDLVSPVNNGGVR